MVLCGEKWIKVLILCGYVVLCGLISGFIRLSGEIKVVKSKERWRKSGEK